jgi:hypothetical protein
MKKETLKQGYTKERNSELLKYVQSNPKILVNKRAIAKINTLLSDNAFKKDVQSIKNSSEDSLEENVYLLLKKYGFTRDWFNTFYSVVQSSSFAGIIEGDSIHLKDLNHISNEELEDLRAVNPIAIFIKKDTSVSELTDFISKSNIKINNLQRKYTLNTKKVNVKSDKDIDIERIIIKNQDKTSKQIVEIINNKYKRSKKKDSLYTYNYVDKLKTKLKKSILNQ